MRSTRPALLGCLLVVATLALGACSGDDGDGSSSDDSSADGAGSGGDCPFDAAELSDATGTAMAEADAPDGAPDTLRCVFVQEGKAIEDLTSFTIAVVDLPDSESLAELNAGFAAQGNVEDLPDLGDGAFVRTSTIAGSADAEPLHEAVVTYQDGDLVSSVVLAGALPQEQVATATAGVVSLLS